MIRLFFIVLPFVGALLLVTSETGSNVDSATARLSLASAVPAASPVLVDLTPLPKSPYLAAKELIRRGDGALAEKRLTELITAHPDAAPYLNYYIAEARLISGDSRAALTLLREMSLIQNRALGLKSLDRLANIFHSSREFDAAIEAYAEIAMRSKGDDRRKANVMAAKSMIAAGKIMDARVALFKVIAAPGSPQITASAVSELLPIMEPRHNLSLQAAGIFYEAGEFSRAADEYASLGSPSPDVMYQHGRALERADRFREAIAVFKKILAGNPGHATQSVKYRIGLCYQRIGQDVEGEKYFNEILASDPRTNLGDDILYRMATRRDQKDQRPQALALYRQLLAKHPRSSWADEAAWKIGLAYLEDDQPQAAEAAFKTALKRYPRSDYAPAMGYWRGRILETSGQYEQALDQYTSVLRNTSDPYYRGRASTAFRKLGGSYNESHLDAAIEETRSGDVLPALAKIRAIRDAQSGPLSDRAGAAAKDVMTSIGYWNDLARFSDIPLDAEALLFDSNEKDSAIVKELNALVAIGAYEEAAAELAGLNIDAGARPERQFAMMRLLAEGGAYRASLKGIESLIRGMGGPRDAAAMPAAASQLLYPRYYSEIIKKESSKYGLDYRFVLAVMREESRFQADVSSWAGAQGLLQIMPTTGAGLAQQLGIPSYRREMLLNPETNIAMGTYFLSNLLKTYDGKHYLALAGYNAGPGNANRWLRQNPGITEEFLIEKIAFKETRNYVKRVLGTYWTYKQLDGELLGVS